MKKGLIILSLIAVFLLGIYAASIYKEIDFKLSSFLTIGDGLSDPTRGEFTKNQIEDTDAINQLTAFNSGTLPTSNYYLTTMYKEYEKELQNSNTLQEFQRSFDSLATTLTKAALAFKSGAPTSDVEDVRKIMEMQLDQLQQKAVYLNKNIVKEMPDLNQKETFLSNNQTYIEITNERKKIASDFNQLKKRLNAILADKTNNKKK